MIDNVQLLKDKSKNFANKNNLQIQVVLQNFMFERFLERLSKSKYKNNFILKGGFLLSSIMGIKMKSTMHVDANIIGMNFNEEEIKKLVNEIHLTWCPVYYTIFTSHWVHYNIVNLFFMVK